MDEQVKLENHSGNATGWLRQSLLPLFGAGMLAAGGAAVYQSNQTASLRNQMGAVQRDMVSAQAQSNETDSQLQAELKAMRDELDQAQKDNSASVAKAQALASRHADAVARNIARRQEDQAKQAELLTEELGKVKESATEASTRLDGITTEVGSVKTDVSTTNSRIDHTNSELQHARGDLGEMSGLIATNSKEIQMLRALGDRNIYEFTIARGAGSQKVGDIQVALRKADSRRNRFTLDVLADDKTVEKKDRTINEPVQFYTSKARQPYEIVVNEVSKDKVKGYLATPKVTSARNTAPALSPE